MKRVILVGHGKMGRMLETLIEASGDMALVGVVDVSLFQTPDDVPGAADVLIDFSYPGNLDATLAYGRRTGCPLVIGTTGLDDAQQAAIRAASADTAVLYAANFSAGVAALRLAAAYLRSMLPDFDVEIIEAHHNQKVDAPSGTAKLLLKALDPSDECRKVYGRSGACGKRGREIGVHAVRGGTVAGVHSVCYFGEDETLELRHSAQSRQVFAVGALRAARFLMERPAGLYEFDEVLKGG